MLKEKHFNMSKGVSKKIIIADLFEETLYIGYNAVLTISFI
jgi:hypothetical protein